MSAAVHLYDRHDPQADPDRSALNLRLEHARAWVDERNLAVLREHIARGQVADALTAAITACLTDHTPLLVWDTASVGGHDVVRWLVRSLREQVLLEGCRNHRLALGGAGLLLPLPTAYAPVRWAPGRTPVD